MISLISISKSEAAIPIISPTTQRASIQDGAGVSPCCYTGSGAIIAKVDLGIATGKRKYDKRQTEKKRDWERQKARLIREHG